MIAIMHDHTTHQGLLFVAMNIANILFFNHIIYIE